ncbi:putative transaldolase [Rosa chinensis]|uniref:Putative transaldolase n=1 Tax=Rosa chinensis TaxID=74649 RepID=A0A2P6PLR7_ROSCH|nr:putative transaldolase [Rosa chinensis]
MALADSECNKHENSELRLSCFCNKALVNVGTDLAKLVPGRVSTEVDARLAYDTHGIIRKHGSVYKLAFGPKGFVVVYIRSYCCRELVYLA